MDTWRSVSDLSSSDAITPGMDDPSKPRGKSRIQNEHHSRNCTEPSSVPSWTLMLASLPVFAVLFTQVIYPLLWALIVGRHVEIPSAYHMVKDTWTKLAAPCPVLVSSRTRDHLRQTLQDAPQMISFSDLHHLQSKSTIVLYKEAFSLSFEGHQEQAVTNTVIQRLVDSHCSIVFNVFTQSFVDQENISNRIDARHTTGSPCLGAVVTCDGSLLPETMLSNIRKAAELHDYIVITKVSSLMPLAVHALTMLTKHRAIVYIQVVGSSVLYCSDPDSSTVWARVAPGDAVVVSASCHKLYIEAVHDVSLAVLASLDDTQTI